MSAAVGKTPSGLRGLDEILGGGLPAGRTTLLCGMAGSGKSVMAMQFLHHGASVGGEPGVYIAFEESVEDLMANNASFGWDLDGLQSQGRLVIDSIRLDPDVIENGSYDLDGLFIRIAAAVGRVGAQRVVLDTIESLFAGLSHENTVRAELQRLFSWLKAQGLTAIVTAEGGEDRQISRRGIEEYVSDCVIKLDHRIAAEQSTRLLRVVKYRGSTHGTNEYPFLISDRGITVLPITSLALTQPTTTERVSSGVPRLDHLLSGGYYRGTSVMISGSAGTGKTTFGMRFAAAACARGERTLYLSYEESPSQLTRNMASVDVDIAAHVDADLLHLESIRPTYHGLETHLAWLHDVLESFVPTNVVIDPLSSVSRVGTRAQVSSMLMRQVDMLKSRGITAVFTSLLHTDSHRDIQSEVSSLIDTWLLLRNVESNGERNRVLQILKSRGMPHSNQTSEFTISEDGIHLMEPYVGPAGVLTGSARVNQQHADEEAERRRNRELAQAERAIRRRRSATQAKLDGLQTELAEQDEELEDIHRLRESLEDTTVRDRRVMGRLRWATREDDPQAEQTR